MKKIIYGALFGLILAIVIVSAGANTNGAPVLVYVYSNSMEPLIRVNDAFLVWPSSRLQVGDIIMYRPAVLEAPYITHRIIAIGEKGYITKGDNSPYKDQESGEPEVTQSRIVGKAVTIHGQPFTIPGLGNMAAGIQSKLGKYTRYLSIAFLLLGIVSVLIENRHPLRRPKPRLRLRLRHIYRGIVIISIFLVMVSIYMGARVSQIKYLVSEYPGSRGDQVPVNQQGSLIMEVRNNGFVPVWTILTGIPPLSVHAAPEYIMPRSGETIILNVMPQNETGIYQGYVQIYNYPILLPRKWIVYLHKLNPIIAIIAEGMSAGLWLTIFLMVLNTIHGLEGWIPLKAVSDKITDRRLKRARAKFIGRRRMR